MTTLDCLWFHDVGLFATPASANSPQTVSQQRDKPQSTHGVFQGQLNCGWNPLFTPIRCLVQSAFRTQVVVRRDRNPGRRDRVELRSRGHSCAPGLRMSTRLPLLPHLLRQRERRCRTVLSAEIKLRDFLLLCLYLAARRCLGEVRTLGFTRYLGCYSPSCTRIGESKASPVVM